VLNHILISVFGLQAVVLWLWRIVWGQRHKWRNSCLSHDCSYQQGDTWLKSHFHFQFGPFKGILKNL